MPARGSFILEQTGNEVADDALSFPTQFRLKNPNALDNIVPSLYFRLRHVRFKGQPPGVVNWHIALLGSFLLIGLKQGLESVTCLLNGFDLVES